MAPEQTKLESETREEIDKKLIAAGWAVQDKNRLNLHESLDVAVRELDAFINSESPNGDKQYGQVPLGRIGADIRLNKLGHVMSSEADALWVPDVTRTQFRKSLTRPEGVLKGKSQAYYEQMKGRGTRVTEPNSHQMTVLYSHAA